jgi:hypothetical protein
MVAMPGLKAAMISVSGFDESSTDQKAISSPTAAAM